ncbi:MAG: M15 family metallopeptidase [Oligoflexia bacterium]|nr:M15 family metallopeptidase [Oligoflexia bacterium]MBF0365440.1 M15 family metallopeptidase [Oligoflexia bacterium]
MTPILSYVLTGKTNEHITLDSRIGVPIHTRAIFPFLSLQKEAMKVGFDLRIASGFRDYDRQMLLWNEKAQGKREILDYGGQRALDYGELTLNREDLLFALLRWSSVPGASRHHWGTEVDVYDYNAINSPTSEKLKLVPSEVEGGGPMASLHIWLDEMIDAKKAFGFFRPYEQDRGGVAMEKWHLSYTPQSYLYDESYNYDFFIQTIEESDIELKDLILQNGKKIFNDYMKNICPYPN